jgi:hypothetical protein
VYRQQAPLRSNRHPTHEGLDHATLADGNVGVLVGWNAYAQGKGRWTDLRPISIREHGTVHEWHLQP